MPLDAIVRGRVTRGAQGTVLTLVGKPAALPFPWWPDTVEYTDLAPTYTDTERPGRTPLATRSGESLEQMRITFTLSGKTFETSAQQWITSLRTITAAKPLAHLMLGGSDRGRWQIRECGYTETDWTDDGDPASVDVTLALRRAPTATISVGPVPPKGRK